jgi:hypothetical protein
LRESFNIEELLEDGIYTVLEELRKEKNWLYKEFGAHKCLRMADYIESDGFWLKAGA